MEVGLSKEVKFDVGNALKGRNLKNMSLIKIVVDPSELLVKKIVGASRILVDDYPIFTKEDPPKLLESYIVDFLATCVTPVAYSYEKLSDHPPGVDTLKRKRKSKSSSDGPFGTFRPPPQDC